MLKKDPTSKYFDKTEKEKEKWYYEKARRIFDNDDDEEGKKIKHQSDEIQIDFTTRKIFNSIRFLLRNNLLVPKEVPDLTPGIYHFANNYAEFWIWVHKIGKKIEKGMVVVQEVTKSNLGNFMLQKKQLESRYKTNQIKTEGFGRDLYNIYKEWKMNTIKHLTFDKDKLTELGFLKILDDVLWIRLGIYEQLENIKVLQNVLQIHKFHPKIAQFIDFTNKLYKGLVSELEKLMMHPVTFETEEMLQGFVGEHKLSSLFSKLIKIMLRSKIGEKQIDKDLHIKSIVKHLNIEKHIEQMDLKDLDMLFVLSDPKTKKLITLCRQREEGKLEGVEKKELEKIQEDIKKQIKEIEEEKKAMMEERGNIEKEKAIFIKQMEEEKIQVSKEVELIKKEREEVLENLIQEKNKLLEDIEKLKKFEEPKTPKAPRYTSKTLKWIHRKKNIKEEYKRIKGWHDEDKEFDEVLKKVSEKRVEIKKLKEDLEKESEEEFKKKIEERIEKQSNKLKLIRDKSAEVEASIQIIEEDAEKLDTNINPVDKFDIFVKKYGYPKLVDPNPGGMAVFYKTTKNGRWAMEHILRDEFIPHGVPGLEHADFWTSTFQLPDIDEFSTKNLNKRRNDKKIISESIFTDSLARRIVARCHFEGANVVSVYLEILVILGELTVAEAKKRYKPYIEYTTLDHIVGIKMGFITTFRDFIIDKLIEIKTNSIEVKEYEYLLTNWQDAAAQTWKKEQEGK